MRRRHADRGTGPPNTPQRSNSRQRALPMKRCPPITGTVHPRSSRSQLVTQMHLDCSFGRYKPSYDVEEERSKKSTPIPSVPKQLYSWKSQEKSRKKTKQLYSQVHHHHQKEKSRQQPLGYCIWTCHYRDQTIIGRPQFILLKIDREHNRVVNCLANFGRIDGRTAYWLHHPLDCISRLLATDCNPIMEE